MRLINHRRLVRPMLPPPEAFGIIWSTKIFKNILFSAPAVYEKKKKKLFHKVNLCVNGKFTFAVAANLSAGPRANTTRNAENTKGRTHYSILYSVSWWMAFFYHFKTDRRSQWRLTPFLVLEDLSCYYCPAYISPLQNFYCESHRMNLPIYQVYINHFKLRTTFIWKHLSLSVSYFIYYRKKNTGRFDRKSYKLAAHCSSAVKKYYKY